MLKGVKYQGFNGPPERGVYVLDGTDGDDGYYMGDWRIDDPTRLYHRHPCETYIGLVGEGMVEYDVTDGVCWKCMSQCPGEIQFAHRLRQL